MKRQPIADLSEELRALDRALGEAADRHCARGGGVSPASSAQLQRRLEEVDMVRGEVTGSRGKGRSITVVALLAAAACLALVAGLTFLGSGTAGHVLFSEGDVSNAGQTEIRIGGALQTLDGRLLALVDARAHVLLNDQTRVLVEAPNRLRLEAGEIWTHVVPGSGPFAVHTPTGIVEVLGTSFTVVHRNGETTVETYSGTVRLSGLKAAEGVLVAAGNRARLSGGEETAQVNALPEQSGAEWAAALAERYRQSSLSTFFPSVAPLDSGE